MSCDRELVRPTLLDRAYAAGLFDGEGSICVTRAIRGDNGKRTYFLRASVSSTTGVLTEFLHSRWGGSIRHTPPADSTRQWTYQWQLVSMGALRFIEDVYPFLLLKKEQALYARNFQAFSTMCRGAKSRLDVVKEMKDKMYWKVRDLKRSHVSIAA